MFEQVSSDGGHVMSLAGLGLVGVPIPNVWRGLRPGVDGCCTVRSNASWVMVLKRQGQTDIHP